MSGTIKDYKDLVVWQEAMSLVELTYELARRLPRSEEFALKQQMRRAAVSVAANIAEGHGSSHRGVFLNHLSISRGSLTELETYVLLMSRLKYVPESETCTIGEQIRKVGRLLNALIRALRSSPRPPGLRSPTPIPRPLTPAS
jgi:four helix bundle protein